MDIEPSQIQSMVAVTAIFQMAESGYCYDTYMLYWREMQVDSKQIIY